MKTFERLLAISLFAVAAPLAAQDAKPAAPATAAAPAEPVIVKLKPTDKLPAKPEQLTIIEREQGNFKSPRTKAGFAVLVHYTGWLYDPSKPDGKGAEFDTTRNRITPFGFMIGAGKVIKGWDLGVVGMHEKGKRTLIIPAHLAYGERERPKIPANSALMFDIELYEILTTGETSTAPQTTAAAPTPPPPPLPTTPPKIMNPADALPATVTELTLIDRAPGDGRTAEAGQIAVVHYTGWLYDAAAPEGKGKKFDSSVDRKQPFSFVLGAGRVIRGWDQGVAGMKEKGKRTLIIPPQFGYGERGAGGVIPPNATLLFDVELIEARPPATPPAAK